MRHKKGEIIHSEKNNLCINILAPPVNFLSVKGRGVYRGVSHGCGDFFIFHMW